VTQMATRFSPAFVIFAASISSFGPEKPVTIEEFKPHLKNGESYSEQWTFSASMKDGASVGVDFFITNLGMGDHKGGFKAEYKEADGKKTSCKYEYTDDGWSSDKDGFHMKFGPNEIQGTLLGSQISVRCEKLGLDLKLENQGPPFQPGGGTIQFGNEGAYSMVFHSPRAAVTGILKQDGQEKILQGIGYLEHSSYDIAPYKQVRRWFRFKVFNENVNILMAEFETPSGYGNARQGWVVVYGPQGRILATARARFEYESFIKDTKSEEGYSIPRKVSVAAVDGTTTLVGSFVMKGIREIKDPLADLDFFRKSIVQQFSKPKEYYIQCSFTFDVKNGSEKQTLEGEGTYRFMYINP
jgi:hypothetical protein